MQQTLKKPIYVSGIGIHSGQTVEMFVQPARENTGIIFQYQGRNFSVAHENFHSSGFSTNVGEVRTVEHLLSALRGRGIDNAIVIVTKPEVPIMDGSAAPFVRMIDEAGISIQRQKRKLLIVREKVCVYTADSFAFIAPFDGMKYESYIDFDHPIIGEQHYSIDLATESFDEIAFARTFGFMNEVESMKNRGLVLGASVDNAVALTDDAILNEEGLRNENEFVQHKLLDAVGDMSILGYKFIGHYYGHKAGHRLNIELGKRLLEDNMAWEVDILDK